MASPEVRCERDGHGGHEIGASEVVDVVVLGDDEALPFAVGERVDSPVQLQQDGATIERELRGIRVGHVDRPGLLAGRAVPELAAVGAGGDVRDDVDLLAGGLERALDREVVARRDHELVRRAV